MELKNLLMFFFIFLIVVMIGIYFFFPTNNIELEKKESSNKNFSLEKSNEEMQFFKNLRFPTTSISYKIDEKCTLKKRADMEEAFLIVDNLTILNFYKVWANEQITVNCEEKTLIENGLFIAGEGGPTNITPAGDYNVITKGEIVLIRDDYCNKPNVAIHELFHVLGFDHSKNPKNIMYEITKCDQEISQDMINLINEIYSVPSYSDLKIEDASAIMNGKFLNANITIKNHGFKKAGEGKIVIYADKKRIKEIDLEPLEVGYGTKLSLYNLWVSKFNVEEITFRIENNFEELTKENNEISFELKK